MNNRKQEVIDYLKQNKNVSIEFLMPTLENFVYLEEQLKDLRKLPKLRVNPNNPEQQKATPAAKMYKELFQQYLNALKVLQSYDKNLNDVEESPLRAWVNMHMNADKEGEENGES